MFLTTQYFQWYCTRLIKLKWSVIISAASQYWEISHQFHFLFLSVFSISGLSPWWSLHPLKSLQRIYDFKFVMDKDGKVVLYVWRKRVWVVGHPMVIIWGNGWGVMPPTYVSLAPRTTAIRVLHSITAIRVYLWHWITIPPPVPGVPYPLQCSAGSQIEQCFDALHRSAVHWSAVHYFPVRGRLLLLAGGSHFPLTVFALICN